MMQKSAFVSIFDLFSIGIGPSSSHTVGPIRAANAFITKLYTKGILQRINQIKVHLYGSLALTGEGHGTPKAIILGLMGFSPESVLPHQVRSLIDAVYRSRAIKCRDELTINFDPKRDLVFETSKLLPKHSNGMRFVAVDKSGDLLDYYQCYSVGGGFIVEHDKFDTNSTDISNLPYPYANASELLAHCIEHGKSIDDIVFENETCLHQSFEIDEQITNIWNTMNASINSGLTSSELHLPGTLQVPRRAMSLYQKLRNSPANCPEDFLSIYAMAVNEENAAGGRIVTAPTNGAAGTIPAVLRYFLDFKNPENDPDVIRKYLLTCSAIGGLYKCNSSISAAEVGCQGEIGVACSMAAAGLTAIQGGSVSQVENAAEIAMEHCLGLTCDPIAGLVQIPCIERNAFGAMKALLASRLALLGEGVQMVSLDTVIQTMHQTGKDMHSKYKETSLGGLAIHYPIC